MAIAKDSIASASESAWQANCSLLLAMKIFGQRLGLALLMLTLGLGCAFAQGAAEYGTITSGMAGSMSGINIMNRASFPTTSSEPSSETSGATILERQPMGGGSPYILESLTDDEASTVNRRTLEQHAGKNAAKLMLRSTPSGAYVRLNGKTVGKTPLLLIIAPGRYTVTMDGARLEQSERKVDLLPHETREFVFPLKLLYPTQVEIKLH